jgi:hypothetical protein
MGAVHVLFGHQYDFIKITVKKVRVELASSAITLILSFVKIGQLIREFERTH